LAWRTTRPTAKPTARCWCLPRCVDTVEGSVYSFLVHVRALVCRRAYGEISMLLKLSMHKRNFDETDKLFVFVKKGL
jgi:hypothetical protein